MKKKAEPMLKTTKFFTASVACALISQASFAGIVGIRTSGSPGSSRLEHDLLPSFVRGVTIALAKSSASG